MFQHVLIYVFCGQDFNFHIKTSIWPQGGHLELTWRKLEADPEHL